jgi:hypothetical protein
VAKTVSIGCGSSWAKDRIQPAIDLANSGLVDYMSYDCLGERTVALAQVRRHLDPTKGQDERIEEIVTKLTPFLQSGKRVTGNFGAANPDAGAEDVLRALRAQGVKGIKVGVLRGDDIQQRAIEQDLELPELGTSCKQLADRIVSANVYTGAEEIYQLLEQGAQFVLGGRLADPSLYVAPICLELGWALDDWDKVALATLAAHLLECGTHVTGGNFADPPYRVVKDLHNLGMPYATLRADSDTMEMSKLPGTGGAVDANMSKAQLGYEIHDPANYITPDVVADFTNCFVEQAGEDRVIAGGPVGRPRPDLLKVLVGIDFGWKGIGEMSFAGTGCVERARLGEEMVRNRIAPLMDDIDDLRIEMHGLNAMYRDQFSAGYPAEVRLRIAVRARDRGVVQEVVDESEHLWSNGPAGCGGALTRVDKAIGLSPAFVPRSEVVITGEVLES